ncbi:glycosyltransferase [Halorussus litoreus]|uniref:glycosyltransferase n=1 Tax=Halorussus litoreus TaxID=1710536 RepID=UPI000E241F36|nr:glycosyltransferase [Halorussus litoreus]
MRILVVAPSVDMGEVGGDSIHLRSVVNHWAREHEVDVISATEAADCPDGVASTASSASVVDFLPAYAQQPLRALVATLRFRVANDYDLVYDRHHLFGSGIVGAAGESCSMALEVNGSFITEHEFQGSISPTTARLLRGYERLLVGWTDNVVCVSPKLADEFRSRGVPERKLAVVANGCDTDAFRPVESAKSELGWDDDADHVGFVGGLFAWHGVERVVEALPAVRERRPRTRFVIVGDGPMRAELESLARERGVGEAVEFVGQVPHEEVPLYMSAFDVGTILKHPAIPGSPLKLFEYLACGTPVLATDDADFDLLDGTSAGEKARYHDADDVARAVLTLLDGDADASAAARSLALDHSWEKVAERALDAATREADARK